MDMDALFSATDSRRVAERIAALEQHETAQAHFEAQMIIIMDEFMAQALRDQRSGDGKGLRELGLTATADVLGY